MIQQSMKLQYWDTGSDQPSVPAQCSCERVIPAVPYVENLKGGCTKSVVPIVVFQECPTNSVLQEFVRMIHVEAVLCKVS